jgi:hypothetical protein
MENTKSLGQSGQIEIDLDNRGGFIAFTHPDDAFLLLRKIIARENRVHAATDGIVSRDSFKNHIPAHEGILLEAGKFTSEGIPLERVKEVYELGLSESPDQCDKSLLYHLPNRPYTSLKDALAVANIVSKSPGKIYIDMENLGNAIASDCRRPLPCPNRLPN